MSNRRAWTPGAAFCLVLLAAGCAAALAQEVGAPPASSAAASAATAPATLPAAAGPETAPATSVASTLPAPVSTQPATASAPALASRRAVPGEPMSLNFRDASLQTVLDYLSEAAGLVIVEVARPEGRVTVMSRNAVTTEEAVALLDTVLKEKGYAAVRNGRTLKIVTLEQAKKELIPLSTGNDPLKMSASDRMVTHIIPIRYVDAVRLKTDLATLIPTSTDVAANASSNTLIVTGTEATARRIVEIIQAIDVTMSEASTVKVFQLKYANAAGAARLIGEIFREDQAARQGGVIAGFGGGGGGRAFVIPGAPGGGALGGAGQPTQTGGDRRAVRVTASADDRTNTLVVSAAPDVMKVIEVVVKELDSNPEQQSVFIYRVRNAQAKNLEAILNSIFGWTGTPSGGTTAARQTGAFGTTGGFGATGGSSASGGFGASSGLGGRTSGTSGIRGLGGSNTGAFGAGTGATNTQSRTTGQTARTTARTGSAAGVGASDLAGQVFVVADADTNSLLVTAASKNFERVKAIITELDRAVPQVLIKVLIAEVTHDKALDLGVEFSGMNLRRPSGRGVQGGTDFSVAAQTTGIAFRLKEENVTAALRAIASVAKLDVLSRPYILTSDNQQASIMVGQSVPFVTNTQTFDTGTVNNTIEYNDIGIILEVIPHINPQGTVTLDVYPEISTLTGETVPISDTLRAPVFAKRFAQSRVAVQDGQTIVIGGLMEDRITKSVDKVPILGDIPVLSLLFSRTIEKKTKTELLIFLTPHVAQQPADLSDMSEDEMEGTKAVKDAVEPGAFQEHLRGLQRGASTRPARPDMEILIPAAPPNEDRKDDPPPSQPPSPPAAGDEE